MKYSWHKSRRRYGHKDPTRTQLRAQPQRARDVRGLTFYDTSEDYEEWHMHYGDTIPTLEQWRDIVRAEGVGL